MKFSDGSSLVTNAGTKADRFHRFNSMALIADFGIARIAISRCCWAIPTANTERWGRPRRFWGGENWTKMQCVLCAGTLITCCTWCYRIHRLS